MAADGESVALEGGAVPVASAVPGPSAANAKFQAQLDDAVQVLTHRGQKTMAELALLLPRLRLPTALWLLSDQVRRATLLEIDGDPAVFDEFRLSVRQFLLNLQQAGLLDHLISRCLPLWVLLVAQKHAARLVLGCDSTRQLPFRRDGFAGVVAAAAAVVRSLAERQTFHAGAGGSDDDDGGVTECSICLKGFVDGWEVSVMPCPSRGHKFHPDCLAKWLGISNMCPLCRHELPASTSV